MVGMEGTGRKTKTPERKGWDREEGDEGGALPPKRRVRRLQLQTQTMANQDYLQWYFGVQGQEPQWEQEFQWGQELRPQELEWEQPPPVQPGEVERWVQELIDDPELEAAEDLLETVVCENPWGVGGENADRQDRYLWSSSSKEPPHQSAEATKGAGQENRSKPGSDVWKWVSNFVFYGALIMIVLGTVIFSSKSSGRTPFFGLSFFEVVSGSMERVIPQGSLVITTHVPAADIRVGDIITFLRSDEERVTHQVIQVIPDFNGNGATGFQTKGTENPTPDEEIVGAGNVVGVVKAHVNGLGFTLGYIADNIKYVFLLFILILLASIAVRVFLCERTKEKAGGKKEERQELRGSPLPLRGQRGIQLGLASP